MLREVVNVHQQDPRLRRRWFCDDYFDIFVWESLEPDNAIVGFQLCYDKTLCERVLSWRESTGYTHHGIDGGDALPGANRTPIMVMDGVMPLPAVLQKFDVSAARMEPRIRELIRARLWDYGAVCGVELDKPPTGG